MMYINPYAYPEIYDIIPVGRQKHPHLLNYEEDNCDVIIEKKYNLYTLMVPGSGSMYISITEDQAERYMKNNENIIPSNVL